VPEKPKPKVLFLCTGNACRSPGAPGPKGGPGT